MRVALLLVALLFVIQPGTIRASHTATPKSCSKGFYLSTSGCRTCPKNYFCVGGTSSLSKCPIGTTAPSGSESSNDCQRSGCDPGYYLKDGKCEDCMLDNYCVGGNKMFVKCPSGTKAPVKSNSADDCKTTSCSPGFYLTDGKCLMCMKNTYCEGGTKPIVKCPTGTIAAAKSDSFSDCKRTSCDPGYYLMNGKCENCQQNNYCEGGSKMFVKCPTGSIAPAKSDSADDCKKTSCIPGFYLTDGKCLMCMKNTYCEGGTKPIVKCPTGTIAAEKSDSFSDCKKTSCDPGYYLMNGKCENCKQNNYCEGGSKMFVKCPTGSIAPATSDSADDCKMTTCKAGYYLINGQCQSCMQNTYCVGGTKMFQLCPQGYSSRTYSMSIKDCRRTSCQPGYYLINGKCEPCKENAYCVGGADMYKLCPEGTLSPTMSRSVDDCGKYIYLHEHRHAHEWGDEDHIHGYRGDGNISTMSFFAAVMSALVQMFYL